MAGKKVILDTTIIIDIQRGNQEIIKKVSEFEQENIFITPIVIAEFYWGARDKGELAKCRKLVAKFSILSLNEDVVKTFSQFFDEFSLSHRPSIPDMLIGATAINYNIPLYTLNKKDFQFIPEIQLI